MPLSGPYRGGESPLENFSPPLENCFGLVQKIWTPLGKLFASPGVPSWLQAWPLSKNSVFKQKFFTIFA